VDDAREGTWGRCFVMLALLGCYVFPREEDVDGLAGPLHRPMTCSHQTRGHGFLPGAALSRHVAVGGGALLGDTQPLGLDICGGVDYLGTYVIEFYIERIAFTRVCLPYAGIIMVCMRVSLVELPFQTVMG
jgi:hypothetical protein